MRAVARQLFLVSPHLFGCAWCDLSAQRALFTRQSARSADLDLVSPCPNRGTSITHRPNPRPLRNFRWDDASVYPLVSDRALVSSANLARGQFLPRIYQRKVCFRPQTAAQLGCGSTKGQLPQDSAAPWAALSRATKGNRSMRSAGLSPRWRQRACARPRARPRPLGHGKKSCS